MGERGSEGSERRQDVPPCSVNGQDTPLEELNPTFRPMGACAHNPRPFTTPTHQPRKLPPPCLLHTAPLATPAERQAPERRLPAGCSACPSAVLGQWGAGAVEERVEHIPAGSSGWGGRREGGGVRAHATHSVNRCTWRGRGSRPGPPTHSSQRVSTPLLCTVPAKEQHTHTRSNHLIWLIRFKQGLCIKRSPSCSTLPASPPPPPKRRGVREPSRHLRGEQTASC